MACKKISEKQGRKDTASPVKPNLWHQEDRTSNSVNTESKIQDEVSLKMACKKISEKQGRKDTASPVKPNLWHQEDRTSNSVNTESKIQVLHDICFSDIAEETQ